MKAFWPGPLTIVLPKKECVPDIVTSGLPTVAVRMSAHPMMKAVIRTLGRPVAAPSANRFGRISPTSALAVEKELGGRIPMIIDGGACREGLESTIVRPEAGEKRPVLHLLRAGPVTKEMLQRFGRIERPKTKLSRKDRAEGKTLESIGLKPEVPGQLDSHYAPVTPLRLLRDLLGKGSWPRPLCDFSLCSANSMKVAWMKLSLSLSQKPDWVSRSWTDFAAPPPARMQRTDHIPPISDHPRSYASQFNESIRLHRHESGAGVFAGYSDCSVFGFGIARRCFFLGIPVS